MSRLTPNQIREGMAECLRELQTRLANELKPGADERLAKLITTYVDGEVNSSVKKVADIIDEAVVDCVTKKLKELQYAFKSELLSDCAPTIAHSAAVVAVKSVPLTVVMDDSAAFHFPEVSEQTLGQTVVLLWHENKALKEEMCIFREFMKLSSPPPTQCVHP